MQAYLFVHFKEKRTPDGEQVYFGISKDGFHWEEVNGGNPVLWSYYGDKGVRDFTITRTKEGKFVILATDLSLSYGMLNQYQHSWDEISRNGSKCLVLWESDDLIHWSSQRMIQLGDENFGCLWAPDVIYDKHNDDYVIHWSSSHSSNQYGEKGIYYSRTKDFGNFTEPQVLIRKADSGVIDSAMYEEDGKYYLFLKSEKNPAGIILMESEHITGPFEKIDAFDRSVASLQAGQYEAPTAVKLEDGRWCLFLDFYGVSAEEQGYVPFVAEQLSTGEFVRSDQSFRFPYGFKHGTILPITMDEYEKLQGYTKKPSEY
ncbi:sucrose-6-phosphate hydrolase SacC (GH32 family) [Paenibacillus phyllosphaerae]|uniref:Sucrose-6-phosphate hydrolase SacC (GH32 family) n=1 Tax=Paenibacillus phyllosphaerae TaxID=274593 RepID=A0A7W5B4E1_9BACL|nr:glycoside hydrolase family 43 protein [Paenibacillus phyllosphaerae]MBB3113746.1 sucrose-6-phosphate hydrolase SacC (GH32 family) [Paenibacillus phyllosphaerae]